MQNNILLAIQCSAGRRRLRSRPWSTDLTLGRCTSCRTNKWDYSTQNTVQHHNTLNSHQWCTVKYKHLALSTTTF